MIDFLPLTLTAQDPTVDPDPDPVLEETLRKVIEVKEEDVQGLGLLYQDQGQGRDHQAGGESRILPML